jgi:hypothetical protein
MSTSLPLSSSELAARAERIRRALDELNYYEGTLRRDAIIAAGIREAVEEVAARLLTDLEAARGQLTAMLPPAGPVEPTSDTPPGYSALVRHHPEIPAVEVVLREPDGTGATVPLDRLPGFALEVWAAMREAHADLARAALTRCPQHLGRRQHAAGDG